MVWRWRSAVAALAVVAAGSTLGVVSPASAVPTGEYEVDGVLRITAQPGDRRVAVEVYTDIPLHDGGITTYVTGTVDLATPVPTASSSTRVPGIRRRSSSTAAGHARGSRCPGTSEVGRRGCSPASAAAFRSDSFAATSSGERARTHEVGLDGVRPLHARGPAGRRGRQLRMRGMGGRVSRPSLYGVPRVLLGAGDDFYDSRTTSPTPLVVLGGRGADDLTLAALQVGRGGPGADRLRRGVRLVGGRGPDVLTGGLVTRLIDAVDGDRDAVTCASAKTVVRADRLDDVSASCAHVLR